MSIDTVPHNETAIDYFDDDLWIDEEKSDRWCSDNHEDMVNYWSNCNIIAISQRIDYLKRLPLTTCQKQFLQTIENNFNTIQNHSTTIEYFNTTDLASVSYDLRLFMNYIDTGAKTFLWELSDHLGLTEYADC